ncbi:nucleotide exchange factor GrpE [Buchnera aphidicola]|uniref:Protein GrpE n=1 Tax=Buchnera aphidicola (Artemisaphis artemisicola) TaxID=1241836 RepID=A0A4D6XHL4_9GAMM|nr:nucleotide exchange factor GrpE [Buchnera aphidicola]QCI15932.1 nucleotide exchange factor GrpE [Buchnera aphidicola (Artemisaphis artemisicola)]
MINKEENNNKNIKKNNENSIDDNLIKNNLIKFLKIQLQESEEKIIETEKISEQETTLLSNRLEKEIEKARKFSLEKLLSNFLPIIDNIERTLHTIEKNKSKKNYTNFLDKVKFTNNLLKDLCISLNIEKIDKVHISFNPAIHEAMSIYYTDEIESNQIVTVMQPGYILHKSRLLRPAMVVVSKKKK